MDASFFGIGNTVVLRADLTEFPVDARRQIFNRLLMDPATCPGWAAMTGEERKAALPVIDKVCGWDAPKSGAKS